MSRSNRCKGLETRLRRMTKTVESDIKSVPPSVGPGGGTVALGRAPPLVEGGGRWRQGDSNPKVRRAKPCSGYANRQLSPVRRKALGNGRFSFFVARYPCADLEFTSSPRPLLGRLVMFLISSGTPASRATLRHAMRKSQARQGRPVPSQMMIGPLERSVKPIMFTRRSGSATFICFRLLMWRVGV